MCRLRATVLESNWLDTWHSGSLYGSKWFPITWLCSHLFNINLRTLTLNSKMHLKSFFLSCLESSFCGQMWLCNWDQGFSNSFLTLNTNVTCLPLNRFPLSSQVPATATSSQWGRYSKKQQQQWRICIHTAFSYSDILPAKPETDRSLEISNNLPEWKGHWWS